MASDWIPIRVDLLDDPAVIAIAGELGIDEFEVAGRLLKLWSWCNKQLSNGDAVGVTEMWIDRHVSAPGFAAAMVRVGWLLKRESGVEFPNFDRWNSKSAKRRVLTSRRMNSYRSLVCAKSDAEGDAVSVTNCVPREEKRRKKKEEKTEPANSTDPNPPSTESTDPTPTAALAVPVDPKPPVPFDALIPAALRDPAFVAAWLDWVADRKARRNALTERAAKLQLENLEPLGPATAVECIRQSIEKGWTGLFPEKFRGRGGGGSGFVAKSQASEQYAARIQVGAIKNAIENGGIDAIDDDEGGRIPGF